MSNRDKAKMNDKISKEKAKYQKRKQVVDRAKTQWIEIYPTDSAIYP